MALNGDSMTLHNTHQGRPSPAFKIAERFKAREDLLLLTSRQRLQVRKLARRQVAYMRGERTGERMAIAMANSRVGGAH